MPLQELLEQFLLLGGTRRHAFRGRPRRIGALRGEPIELLLQHGIAFPPGHRRREVHVLPLLVIARLLLQSLEPLEEVVDEAREAQLLGRVAGRIRDGEHGGHRDGRDARALGDQRGIVGGFEVGRRVIFELVGVLDRQEFEARRELALEERRQRLRRHPEGGRHLVAGPHLFHRGRVRDEGLFHIDAELPEDDGPRERGRSALRIEVDDLAFEILERVDLRPHEDVHLGGEQAHQVVDTLHGRPEFRLRLEVIEHVTVDDGGINAPQVEQVVDVVERPARHHRDEAHVVAVVEDAGEFRREL